MAMNKKEMKNGKNGKKVISVINGSNGSGNAGEAQPRRRILWMSRHNPTRRQHSALAKLWPNYELILDKEAYDGAADIVARFVRSNAAEMVVVAPMLVVEAILKCGVEPIWAQMAQCAEWHEHCEVVIKGRAMRFVKFWRITGLNFKLAEIQPMCADAHRRCGCEGLSAS